MPSAGKSTELKRIAKLLAEKTKSTNHVVHLCLIQNDFSPGSGIFNVDDLWSAILRCHSAPELRKKHSLKDFCDFHANNSAKPILLIDTLDILPYGMDVALHDNLLQIWRQLVEQLSQSSIQVIWTCRTMEARLFKSNLLTPKPFLAWMVRVYLVWFSELNTLNMKSKKKTMSSLLHQCYQCMPFRFYQDFTVIIQTQFMFQYMNFLTHFLENISEE